MPIITTTGITRDGFVLPPNHSWDAQLINGKKKGIVTVKDEYGRISHKLEYVNDQLNGIAEFYNHGELVEKRTFVNNIEEGWSCEYKRGREVRWFMYSNGRKTGELKQYQVITGYRDMTRYGTYYGGSYWKLFDIKTNSLISICSYDNNHKCIGKGYLYVNNHIDRVVMYTRPNVEGLVLKRFNGNEMTEYDKKGNEVYKGGYKDDINEDYPREGKGKEFVNNILIYEGEFHYNKREGNGSSYKEGKLDYSGEWKNGLPDGNGWMIVFGEVYDGEWVKGRYQVNGNYWYNYSTGTYEYEDTPKQRGSFLGEMVNTLARFIADKITETYNNDYYNYGYYYGRQSLLAGSASVSEGVYSGISERPLPRLKDSDQGDTAELSDDQIINDIAGSVGNEENSIFCQD